MRFCTGCLILWIIYIVILKLFLVDYLKPSCASKDLLDYQEELQQSRKGQMYKDGTSCVCSEMYLRKATVFFALSRNYEDLTRQMNTWALSFQKG